MKKVTIIVPVFNAEKYLYETIKSILTQSYSNLEIILINDGSKDGSQEIIDSFKNSDPRIISITTENCGAPHARNTGIEASSGDYILFFDADDVMEIGAIEKMLSVMQPDVELVVGSNIKIKEDGTKFRRESVESGTYYTEEHVCYLMHINPFPNNKLYLGRIIRENCITFSNVKIAQDLNFYYKYLAHCKTIVMISDPVCLYRIVENSVSHTYNLNVLDIIKCTREIESYVIEKKVEDAFLQAMYSEFIRHCNFQLSKIYRMKTKKMKIMVIDCLYDYMSEVMRKIKNPSSETQEYYNRICRFKKFIKYFSGDIYSKLMDLYWRIREILINAYVEINGKKV